ncbi:MAG: Malto-oligosyltrehalose trehalohydrolase [Labilithrix sp.]|nr:Malto-oligosyltrehalose trehalohydrolase [Labilithrix sp.]
MKPGAHVDANGTTFAAFTTKAREVKVRLFEADGTTILRDEPLEALGEGSFERHLTGVAEGALYAFVLDGDQTPDPFARSLPKGVHGPARVVAPAHGEPLAQAPPLSQWVIYELHVGTFSPEGTFKGAEARLDALAELGVTAIEILPVAAFAGQWGWGYDGVALYATHAAYGEPEDLRSLVAAAHGRGLAVILDVVYNHFGPAGNYLWKYAPEYFTEAVQTPWGPAPDFAHAPMRNLVLGNVRYWLEELGIDALRLDAAHEIRDPKSNLHVLREITDLAHGMTPPRHVFFEDERNDPMAVNELGADAVWADDLHHQLHVLLTGERDGYYAAYEPTTAALAKAIEHGFTYVGQPFEPWKGKPRGKLPREHGVAPGQLLYCLQNHDQIGNRALGDRISSNVDVDAYCAASMLLLFLPGVPLLFMGQEWAASSPFLFFSDHEGELGEAVRKGRREEFKAFAAFADPAKRDQIPDPQARSTFEASKLPWAERTHEPHRRVHVLYRKLVHLRTSDRVLGAPTGWDDLTAVARGDLLEVTRRHAGEERRLFVNLGAEPRPVEVPAELRVLVATGSFDAGVLGPKSAVMLASGPSSA